MNRRSYLNDFREDGRGSYTYEGRLLRSSYAPETYRRKVTEALIWFGAAAVLQVLAGCIPGTGMEGHLLIVLPYALGIGVTVRLIWILVRMRAGGEKLREYVHGQTAARLPFWLILGQIVPLVSLTAAAVCLIRHTFLWNGAASVLWFAAEAALLAAAARVRTGGLPGEWS